MDANCRTIRIYHECEDGIEKIVPRVTVWHHEACWVADFSIPFSQK